MVKKYIMPSFKDLSPRRIQQVNREIKQSKYYSGTYKVEKKPDKERFLIAYEKFKNKKVLKQREFKILASYLDKIDEDNKLDVYLDGLERNLNTFLGFRGFIRPLLSFIYNCENLNKKKKVYFILKKVLLKISNKARFKKLSEDITKNSLQVYLAKVSQKFQIKDILEWEDICYNYKIQTSDRIYITELIDYIIKNFEEEKVFYMFKENIKTFEQRLQNQIYEKVMLSYLYNKDVDSYDDKWFELIKDQLGDPYAKTSFKWNEIDNRCKEIFRLWNNNNYIREFFDNVAGDRRRLTFWKKYIDCIYRIQFYEEKNKALAMEFKKHLFVEFAQQGNAMYYYDKEILDIDEFEKQKNGYSWNIHVLKDKSKCIDSVSHANLWEYKFDDKIQRLGYKIRG